jgi:hypothetical protein
MPKGYEEDYLIVHNSVQGDELEEGAAPKIYMICQDGLEKYAKDWRRIFAEVSDSTGKVWKSKNLPKRLIPSWARK